jgi:hypothetical protein
MKTTLTGIATIVALFSTILCNAQCCTYTLIMDDTYGDGWNGGQLEVWMNGNSLGFYAAENEGSSATFEVCNLDELQLVYSSGDYENENSYFLAGGNGNLIVQEGPEPPVGESEIIVVDCDIVSEPGSNPCGAIMLEEGCTVADNSTSFGSGYQGNCAEFQGADIWFTAIVPESGGLIFETEYIGAMNDTGIQIWTGNDCTSLTAGPCNDDGGSGYLSLIAAYGYEPGTLLYLQLWGYGGQTGAFNLCMTDPGIVELVSSELPIFSFFTDGQEIPDEPKIDGLLEVRYNGPGSLNFLSDDPVEYNGNVGIEIRGATSANYPQKPYAFETRDALGENNNVSLVGFPAENDWNLLSSYNDKSLIRNLLAQHLFEAMGNYAPRTTLVEVMLNDSYQGIYAFCEKIKVDSGRVDIAKLNPDENEGDDVTGGYILELNYWNSNNSWELGYTPLDHPDFDVHMVYRYPKPEVVTQAQKTYIAFFVDSLETAMYGQDFMDPEIGFRNYLDIESFIDYFLINELSRNNDGFKKSRYFHKDKYSNGGKLKAGPTWDFDWAWKDMWTCTEFENQDGSGWAHLINNCPTDNYSPDWYIRMLQDTTYANHMRCRYEEYREEFLNIAYIDNFTDSIASVVENAQLRHYQKWPFWGVSTDAPEIEPLAESYSGEIGKLQNWINLRLNWLDDNLPGHCYGPIIQVEESERESAISLYPNPTQESLWLKMNNQNGDRYEIWNIRGQCLKRDAIMNQITVLHFEHEGLYVVRVFQGSQLVHSERVTVIR